MFHGISAKSAIIWHYDSYAWFPQERYIFLKGIWAGCRKWEAMRIVELLPKHYNDIHP